MSYLQAILSVDEPELITVTDQTVQNADRPITVAIGMYPIESVIHLSRIAASRLLVDLANALGREVRFDDEPPF